MTPDRLLVTYMRVSTSKQGRSGLGLDAQRAALIHFAQTERFDIVEEFIEVDSGKGHDALERRPQLKVALAQASLEIPISKMPESEPSGILGKPPMPARSRSSPSFNKSSETDRYHCGKSLTG